MELTEEEKEIIRNYRSSTENRKRILINYSAMFANASRKERGIKPGYQQMTS